LAKKSVTASGHSAALIWLCSWVVMVNVFE
jgi:hypothetical protein